jgi:hypothetical protein
MRGATTTAKGSPPPQITIDDPPEHGIICLRRGDLWLKATIENNLAHCLGKKVSGFHVIYIARKDYTGPDHVHYTVVFPTVQHSMDVTLNVWPDSSKTSVATPRRYKCHNRRNTTAVWTNPCVPHPGFISTGKKL